MDYNKEVSVNDFRQMVFSAVRFIKSNFWIFVASSIIFACIGIFYAWFMKPQYTAEITFAAETDKQGISAYSGLAAQFGLDLSSGGGSVFEGENLMQFFKSRMLIEKALLSTVEIEGKKQLLINRYISFKEMDKQWKDDPKLKGVVFQEELAGEHRVRDSILNKIVKDISDNLIVDKLDKKNNITSVRYTDRDEIFAKVFVEQLVNNALDFYMDYKSKKSRQNVKILQRQADSVKALLTGGIVDIATTSDLNLNPIRQITRAPLQRKQVDIQVNSKLYEEILKQLELSKITMRKETPLVQIIDTPRYPLEKKKLGRLKGAIIFGLIGAILGFVFVVVYRFLKGGKEVAA